MQPDLLNGVLSQAVYVRPGDTLIVAVDRSFASSEADASVELFEQQLPRVKVVVVNARQLLVYRPELGG